MSTAETTPVPDATSRPTTRYRCRSCGNLTRFDVTRTTTTSSFLHFTVGGECREEDVVILDDIVVSIACRWCGPRGEVVEVANESPASGGDQPPAEP